MSKRFDWDARNNNGRDANGLELDFHALWQAVLRQKWRLVTPALVVLAVLGLWLALVPPRYTAVARVAGVAPENGLESPLDGVTLARASSQDAPQSVLEPKALKNQLLLLSSEDFARRALSELRDSGDLPTSVELADLENGAVSARTGQALRPLLRRIGFQAAAESAPDSLLLDWLRRGLAIKVREGTSDLSITFEAEDAGLAAKVANKYAELYLDLQPSANSVAAAVAARQSAFPHHPSVLVLGPLATLMIGFAALFAREYRAGRLAPASAAMLQQPRALGEIKLFARFDERPSAEGPGGLYPLPSPQANEMADAAEIAVRIRKSRRDDLATHIVVTGVNLAGKSARPMIGLGRQLAQEGRTILVDLDGAWQGENPASDKVEEKPGLAEVLDGQASFAEAIRRDPASRLHILLAEPDRSFDLRAFDVVFEALSQTYDFVLVTAPPLDQSPLASRLTAKANLVILATLAQHERLIESAHADLRQNTGCEVLVIGVGGRLMPRLVENAA
ncbi:LPS biosynthesis protein [Beijerinckia indica]|uniref:Lipopolysaccharide biosynthesis protein n=1 Tax=Beijerinckia indica subsp. indica (strain ATCC 9039 / DSM 1715 / NCIMB 8712) TaxID=395963 RepID=B2IH42_BEII9|nr:LPS biosynthesis protein [Beijerinckia indica]ACB94456.1 lipopolysaccharide biosynthesis protein [Beijerinckia indica subsp. indica ATCC 9039]